MKTKLAILGSTGSIGTQTLDVVRQHPEALEVFALTAGNNAELLIKQAIEFKPKAVVIANEAHFEKVKAALQAFPIKVCTGSSAVADIVEHTEIDIVVMSLVGFAGLEPTIRAIKAGKRIALATKETMVVAGEFVTHLAQIHHSTLLPLDSEHSAIFQCIRGNQHKEIDHVILTASGGPFRNLSKEELQKVTPSQALAHPTWMMGDKITIDSATMMNKGFEMIEACWFFNLTADQIKVVVHPESLLHSAVEFKDGVIIGQLGSHDMRMPIQYALSYPDRWPLEVERLDFAKIGRMTFEEPDFEKFPCLSIAYDAIKQGGSVPCVMNAANEIANLAFRKGRISITRIPDIIETTISHIPYTNPQSLEEYIAIDHDSRIFAQELITD